MEAPMVAEPAKPKVPVTEPPVAEASMVIEAAVEAPCLKPPWPNPRASALATPPVIAASARPATIIIFVDVVFIVPLRVGVKALCA